MMEHRNHDLYKAVEHLRAMVLYGSSEDLMEALCAVNIVFTDMVEGAPLD